MEQERAAVEQMKRETGRLPLEKRVGRAIAPLVLALVLGFCLLGEWHAQNWMPCSDLDCVFTIAAALDHPEAFSNDAVYSDARHFLFYTPLFVEGVRAFHHLLGEAGAFTRFFSPVLLLLTLAGFYLMGRELMPSRWGAVALSLLSVCMVRLPRGTFIGWLGYRYVTPRTFFLAGSPFVIYLVLRYQNRVWSWFVGMALMGVLAYVHPVSAPVVALALWASLFVFHPRSWSYRRRIATALACGLTFLVVVVPYVVWYRDHVVLGGQIQGGMNFEQASVMTAYRIQNAFDPVGDLVSTLSVWMKPPLLGITITGLAAFVLGLHVSATRKQVCICILWLVGIWVAAFVVPSLDLFLSRLRGQLPSQISLSRGMRYFAIPLMSLSLLLPAAAAHCGSRLGNMRMGVVLKWGGLVACVAAVAWMIIAAPPVGAKELVYQGWRRGKWVPPVVARDVALRDAFAAIKRVVPPGARLISNNDVAAINARWYCLRPLAHANKDGGLLFYTDWLAFARWVERDRQWKTACAEADHKDVRPLLGAAIDLGADFLLTDAVNHLRVSDVLARRYRLVWANKYWALYDLRGTS